MAKPTLNRTPTAEAITSARTHNCAFLMLGHEKFALLDHDNWERLRGFTWHFNLRGYAARLQYRGGGQCDAIVYLHREIMGNDPNVHYDHINRNKLDCRRCNLRVASQHDNAGNIGKRKQKRKPTSRFKGVSFDRNKQRWMAQGREHGRMVMLGRFRSETAAASAYDSWAKSYFGEFAFTNNV